MPAPEADRVAGGGLLTWEAVSQFLQALAGLATLVAWVVLVGGIRSWSRLQAAEVPQPTRTVTLLPREQLLAEGIRVLAIPLALGALIALALYLLASLSRSPFLAGVIVIPLLAGGGVAFAIIDQAPGDLRAEYWGLLVLLSLAVVALAAVATLRWRSAAGQALIAFALIVVWGGMYGLIAERGNANPRFEPVQVIRKDGWGTRGLLLARSGNAVTLICVGSGNRSLLELPGDDVRQLSFQRAQPITDHQKALEGAERRDCTPARAKTLQPPQGRPGSSPDRDPEPPGSTPPTTPTGPDPPAPPDEGADTTGPTLESRLPRRVDVGTPPTFVVKLGTFREPVTGVVSFFTVERFATESGRHRVKLATKAFRAERGGVPAVRVGLSSYARRLLRDRRRIRVEVVTTARDRLGNAATFTGVLTLVP